MLGSFGLVAEPVQPVELVELDELDELDELVELVDVAVSSWRSSGPAPLFSSLSSTSVSLFGCLPAFYIGWLG